MRKVVTSLSAVALALVLALASAEKPGHVESPPEGISPNEFAIDYKGCLGGLRSAIARGEIPGFEDGFGQDLNPGLHQGTVGEEEFLKQLTGYDDEELAEFCSNFEKGENP